MYEFSYELPTIYKRDSKGKVRVWTVEIGHSDDDDDAGYRVIAGLLDGEKVISGWKDTVGKNLGKSNQTTARGQAVSQATSARTKKLDKEYFEAISDIDTFSMHKPMLASTYGKVPCSPESEMVYVQPKLDGIRCIARADGMWTREFKPIVSCPHINDYLAPFFKEFPDAVLDGELYNHKLKDQFNEIVSMVRKSKGRPDELVKSAEFVEYHVYDGLETADSESVFNERYRFIYSQHFDGPVQTVESHLVSSSGEIDSLYLEFLKRGYEGEMVRRNTPYEGKRSKNLQKRKEFLTKEFPVINMLEGQGNWSNCTKHFTLPLDVDKGNGTDLEFKAGVRGNKETLAKLWKSGNTPDWVTLRFFTRTPDGIPRFPVVIDWGYGVRED